MLPPSFGGAMAETPIDSILDTRAAGRMQRADAEAADMARWKQERERAAATVREIAREIESLQIECKGRAWIAAEVFEETCTVTISSGNPSFHRAKYVFEITSPFTASLNIKAIPPFEELPVPESAITERNPSRLRESFSIAESELLDYLRERIADAIEDRSDWQPPLWIEKPARVWCGLGMVAAVWVLLCLWLNWFGAILAILVTTTAYDIGAALWKWAVLAVIGGGLWVLIVTQ